MKRYVKFLIGMLIGVTILAGCDRKQEENFPCPLQPASLISSMFQDHGDFYELSGLPWYTDIDTVKKQLSKYEIYYEDETMIRYRAKGALEDQTPFINDIWVGFKQGEKYQLCGVRIDFYMEQSARSTTETLANTMFEQLNDFVIGQKTSYEQETISHGISYTKETGSYITLQYIKEGETLEQAPYLEWDKVDTIQIHLWLPEDRARAILDAAS